MGQAKQRGPRELRMAQSIERKRVEAEAARVTKVARQLEENERLRKLQEARAAARAKGGVVIVGNRTAMRTLHLAAALGMIASTPAFIIADKLENKDED